MKHNVFAVFLSILFSAPAFANDFIWQMQGDTVLCRNLEHLTAQVDALTPSGVHRPVEGCRFLAGNKVRLFRPPQAYRTDYVTVRFQHVRTERDAGLRLISVQRIGEDA